MARVSIVIPAYNAAPYIAQTVESVCQSSWRDFEIIVIDDGSRDVTAEIVNRIAGADPRVRLISQPNAGMSASRNRGANLGDSEYVALIDSDDIWHPDKLRWQLQRLRERPDHDFAYSAFTPFEGEVPRGFTQQARQGYVDEGKSGWVYHHLILDNYALPSSVLFTRSAWVAMGGFRCDDQKTDDWEFLVRASQQFKFVRLAESMVLYRQVPTSLSRRLASTNGHELMRDAMLARFGPQSPDGTLVDPAALQNFRYTGACNFADSHCARGDLGLGLREFAKLLRSGPYRSTTAGKLGKALFRRVFPKSLA